MDTDDSHGSRGMKGIIHYNFHSSASIQTLTILFTVVVLHELLPFTATE